MGELTERSLSIAKKNKKDTQRLVYTFIETDELDNRRNELTFTEGTGRKEQ